MTLDRGTLAKIDRRIFSELSRTEGVQLVKVPVSDAVWSTWRRYCDAIGFTMGLGVAALIDHELGTVVSQDANYREVFGERLQQKLVMRSEELDARERRLNEQERSLRATVRRLRARTVPLQSPTCAKVGRNEPCPCGSGFKYKRCHGS